MFEILEKVMLTGLGALALSQKKAEELAQEIKERYKLSEDEGKAFLEKMLSITKESREKASEMVECEVQKVIAKMGLVQKSDYDALLKRVETLERQSQGAGGE